MVKIVIKKRVELDFLGEEYQGSYLILKSISVGEYDNLKGTVRDEVINRLIDGEIKQDGEMVKITKENILELPAEVFVEAFAGITGEISPKANRPLITPSSIKDNGPEN